MKRIILCCLFFLSSIALATISVGADRGGLNGWSVRKNWQFGCQPTDFSQSLDKKWVFVLGDDSKVHILTIDGEEKGRIPVAEGTLALDIEARGEMLYLMDKNGMYTAISISLAENNFEWSIQKTWKTTGKPLSFAHSKKKSIVFVLEEDNAVHAYSFSGNPLGDIPVDPGTIAIDVIPRKNMLYLMSEDKTYTALNIFF